MISEKNFIPQDYIRGMTVNCMYVIICQLDWAMGCLDISSMLFLGVSVRVILDETNIQIG